VETVSVKNKFHTKKVLELLSEASESQMVETLVEKTQLGPTIYPVLAQLHKHGLVEPQWIHSPGGPKLSYHITLKGRQYQQAPQKIKQPWSLEPWLLKVKSWFA
jgi:DNA-binding PadR family transcriptional regulator